MTTPRALIIEARFYADINDMLLQGARAELEANGFSHETVTVPGVLEIPPALSIAMVSARRRNLYIEAYVALGCVIRGETGHYDIVANEGNRALMNLAVENRLAFGNGILTVENRDQAEERADPNRKNKGADAAAAAVALYNVRTVFKS